jgi:hypothetical protein
MCVLPYRTSENVIDGVVITFTAVIKNERTEHIQRIDTRMEEGSAKTGQER